MLFCRFAPALCKPLTYSLGVCLSVMHDPAGAKSPTWRLTEGHNQWHQPHGVKGCPPTSGFATLANGTLKTRGDPGSTGDWYLLGLGFSNDNVVASIGGQVVAHTTTTMTAGVVAVGSAWNTAFFRELSVKPSETHAVSDKSFLYDILPSSTAVSNFSGWAGLILDLV